MFNNICSNSFCRAVAIGFSGYVAAVFFPQLNPVFIAIVLIVVLSFVNFYGISESVWINTVFTFIELAGLVIIILAGFWLGSPTNTNYFEIPDKTSSSHSLFSSTASSQSYNLIIGAILGGSGLIFFAYYGFENIVNIADETKNPAKVIPKALLISIIVTTVFYILVAVSTSALVGWKELSLSEAPLSLAAEKAFGRLGVFILSFIALFATSNTALMMLISGSRIAYGMAKNHSFPTILAKVHNSRKTPWMAVVIAMVSAIVTVIVSSGNISVVASIAVFSIFFVYAIVNIALIWLRFKNPEIKRPFVSPVRLGNFPLLAGIGLVTSITMLFQFNREIALGGFLAILSIALVCLVLIIRTKPSNDNHLPPDGQEDS